MFVSGDQAQTDPAVTWAAEDTGETTSLTSQSPIPSNSSSSVSASMSSEHDFAMDQLGLLEQERDELQARCKQLEQGVYGLPEAVTDIQALKAKLAALSESRAELLQRVKQLTAAVETVSDQNKLLRKQSGIAEDEGLDLTQVRLAKEATISELTAVNACLEREVGELEEERRRLKAHLKFNAKHSQVAVHPALTPDQLAAVDAFIATLKMTDRADTSSSASASVALLSGQPPGKPSMQLHPAASADVPAGEVSSTEAEIKGSSLSGSVPAQAGPTEGNRHSCGQAEDKATGESCQPVQQPDTHQHSDLQTRTSAEENVADRGADEVMHLRALLRVQQQQTAVLQSELMTHAAVTQQLQAENARLASLHTHDSSAAHADDASLNSHGLTSRSGPDAACESTAGHSQSTQQLVGPVQQDAGSMVCCKVYAVVQQQLHSLSSRHQTLLEQQAGVVTQASDSVQLRAELAKTRLDLAQALDKLVAVQATHRLHQQALQSGSNQNHAGSIDPGLIKDLVDSRVREASALRQADSAEQQRRQAQQAAQQAHDSLGHMEAHVAGLARQLYQAQQEQRQVHQHYEGGACYAEVQELWQRAQRAEQAQADAQTTLQTLKDQHAQAAMNVKELQRQSTDQKHEEAALRAALRAADAKCPAPVQLVAAQAEMASLRGKLSLAYSAANHQEVECSRLQDSIQELQMQASKVQGALATAQSSLRWAQEQQAAAEAAAHIAQAGQVAAWKCEAWLRSMQRLQASNDELAASTDQLWKQLLAAVEAKAAAEAKLEHYTTDQVDAPDRAVQLKVDNAQLRRADSTLRARCSQLQEAVTALEAGMRLLEADSIAQQEFVDQLKCQAEGRVRELAAQMHSQQQHIALRGTEAAEAQVKLAALQAQLKAAQEAQASSEASSDADQMRDATRKVLLAQVEQLRQARLQAEAYKEQLTDAQQQQSAQAQALQQLQEQHQQLLHQMYDLCQKAAAQQHAGVHAHEGAALEQVQALAQATIQELHDKLAARSAQLQEVQANLESARGTAASEVASLQRQVQQLTQLAQQQDQQHLQDLLEGASPAGAVGELTGSPRHGHLQTLLQQVSLERDVLQKQLEQAQAQYKWQVQQLRQDVQAGQQQHAQLQADLQSAQQGSMDRSEQRRHALAAAAKDRKLAQLQQAIQALEAKLVHLLQARAQQEEGDDKDQELLRKALQDKAALQDQVQHLRGQVAELQFRGVIAASQSSLASSSSRARTPHASNSDRAVALKKLQATVAQQQNVNSTLKADYDSLTHQLANAQRQISSLKKSQQVSQSKADQANMAKQSQADLTQQQDVNNSLRAECDSLRQQVAETRRKSDEKERQMQGLQKLLEGEERSGHVLKQQLIELKQQLQELRQQLLTASASRSSSEHDHALQVAAANAQSHLQKHVSDLEQQHESDQQHMQHLQQQVTQLKSDVDRLSHAQAKQRQHLQQQLQQAASATRTDRQPLQEHEQTAAGPANCRARSPQQKSAMAEAASSPGQRAGQDENGPPQSLLADNPGLLQWEEKKKLQKRMEILRGKLKEKATLLEQAEKEGEKRKKQLQQANADLARQAVMIRELQAQGKVKKEGHHAGAPLDQVGKLLKAVQEVEAQRDSLELQLASAQQHAMVHQPHHTPPSNASMLPLDHQLLFKEAELVEARLAQSQAQAKAQRAQQRLDELLDDQGGLQQGSKKSGGPTKQALLDTIQGLQKALERSRKECEAAVSSAKYMQVVEKKKELAAKCSALEEEVRIGSGIKQEAQRLEQRCQQVQASNTALTRQLTTLQHHHKETTATAEQVEQLQADVDGKHAELLSLRKALQHAESQVAQLRAAEGAVDEEAAEEISALREQMAAVAAENDEMRNELSAFDPAFFDEIEDLKYDHHQLKLRCQDYKQIVQELSSQIGISPPVVSESQL